MSYDHDLLKVSPTGFSLAPGRLLVSVPFFNDVFFNRSLVLLTDYDAEHCAGLIVNHQLQYAVCDLVDELRVDAPMFLGGPVEPSALFLLHDFGKCKGASKIVPDIYVGYDDNLLNCIAQRSVPAMKYKFMMGYAGWSPGQLEHELSNNMWVVGNPTPDLVFNTASENMWTKAVRILGREYEHWLRVPKYINLN